MRHQVCNAAKESDHVDKIQRSLLSGTEHYASILVCCLRLHSCAAVVVALTLSQIIPGTALAGGPFTGAPSLRITLPCGKLSCGLGLVLGRPKSQQSLIAQ